jgi:hypothetical protein
MWGLPDAAKDAIMAELEGKFGFLYEQLRVTGTSEVVAQHVAGPLIVPARPAGF